MVDIAFLTNRNDLGTGLGTRFGPQRATTLTAGVARVRLTEAEAPAIQIFEDAPQRIGGLDIAGAESGPASLPVVITALESRLPPDADILVFVHGYDTGFAQALCYGAQLQVQIEKRLAALRASSADGLERPAPPLHVLVVTWPSDGRSLFYFADRQDAQASGTTLSRLLLELRAMRDRGVQASLAAHGIAAHDLDALAGAVAAGSLRPPRKIHLLCQSMGALVLASAYVPVRDQLYARNFSPLFDIAAFTGADVGHDAFADPTELGRFHGLCDLVHVYFNTNDTLGMLSRVLLSRKPMSRYGAIIPPDAANLDVLDVTDVIEPDRDKRGHYYARVNRVVQTDLALSICGADRDARSTRVGPGGHFRLKAGSGIGDP